MTDAELYEAMARSIELSYYAGQWWLTISTAFVIAIYFAGKRLNIWVFSVVTLLYASTALSVFLEILGYNRAAAGFGERLAMTMTDSAIPQFASSAAYPLLTVLTFYSVYVMGTLGVIGFCIVTWREARLTE